MAGGNDPDNIIGKKNVSDTPSPPIGPVFEGSLAPLVADKSGVDHTNIKLTSEQVTELCGRIKDNDNLQVLNLRNSSIGNSELQALIGQRTNKLEMLNLNCNQISSEGIPAVLDTE